MFNSGCYTSFAKWVCLSLALALALFSASPTRAQVATAGFQQIQTLLNCSPGTTACGPVGTSSPISSNPTTLNYEPRIGLSWDPRKGGKTAVRAGFGTPDASLNFNRQGIRNRMIDPNPHRADVLNWNLNIRHEIANGWTALVG
jgi:hypothetical protein